MSWVELRLHKVADKLYYTLIYIYIFRNFLHDFEGLYEVVPKIGRQAATVAKFAATN